MENGSEPGSEPDVQAYSGDQLDEEDLRCQLAEKTNAINNLEQELRKVTARAENEAIALSAVVEVAEEHEGSNGDLQKHFNEAIAIASALEKKCEALTNEKIKSESKIATTVQDAEMQRSDIAELQKSLTAASEELMQRMSSWQSLGIRLPSSRIRMRVSQPSWPRTGRRGNTT